jgi:hypothetical protein
MLLIILLGAIAQLVAVSADCDIGTINLDYTNWTNVSLCVPPIDVLVHKGCKYVPLHCLYCLPLQFTGTWYWVYHTPDKLNDDLVCRVSAYVPITKYFARVTTNMYVNRLVHNRKPLHWAVMQPVPIQFSSS